jgi:ketosteroid isomerase-like protein
MDPAAGRSSAAPVGRRSGGPLAEGHDVDLDALRVNELSADGWAWYRSYLTVLDAYDLDGYTALLAPDVSLQFNNDEPLTGREVVEQALGRFWGSISAMGYELRHAPLNIYGDDQRFVTEALNHYTKGGERITVHATAWTDRDDDGRVTSVRLYQDLSPLEPRTR